MLQEPALDAELETLLLRAHEAADRPAGTDDAMTGHDDGNRVGAACAADRARRGTKLRGHFTVAADLSGRNALHRLPHRKTMPSAGELDRKVEAEGRVLQVLLQLHAREERDRVARRCESANGWREEADAGHVPIGRRDAERGEWRAHTGLESGRACVRHSKTHLPARESSSSAPAAPPWHRASRTRES